MDGANGNCDEEKENEEGVADIVPGVEVEEDAGTIQLPEATRQFSPFKSQVSIIFGPLSPQWDSLWQQSL